VDGVFQRQTNTLIGTGIMCVLVENQQPVTIGIRTKIVVENSGHKKVGNVDMIQMGVCCQIAYRTENKTIHITMREEQIHGTRFMFGRT
jgi:hypothetical protein